MAKQKECIVTCNLSRQIRSDPKRWENYGWKMPPTRQGEGNPASELVSAVCLEEKWRQNGKFSRSLQSTTLQMWKSRNRDVCGNALCGLWQRASFCGQHCCTPWEFMHIAFIIYFKERFILFLTMCTSLCGCV